MQPTRVLARLQQAVVLGVVALAGAGLLWLWPHSPLWAVLLSLAILMAYALLLALEFAWAARVNRQGPAPHAGAADVLTAWLREVRTTPQVFGWRQPFRSQAVADTNLGNWPAATRIGRDSGAELAPCGVILIHGFFCNRGIWTPWLQPLQAAGHPFIALNLWPVLAPIDDYIPLIDAAVQRMTQATGQPPALVCHSMGGLAARAWRRAMLQRVLQGTPALPFRHIVTIGTPHHGTVAAQFGQAPNARQMRVGNPWLVQLACDEAALAADALPYAAFTCWYSNTDNIVFPAVTATLPGADNQLAVARGHVELALAPEVLAHILALLAKRSQSAVLP